MIPCARAHLARFTRAWNWLPVALADELAELDEPHAATVAASATAVMQVSSIRRALTRERFDVDNQVPPIA